MYKKNYYETMKLQNDEIFINIITANNRFLRTLNIFLLGRLCNFVSLVNAGCRDFMFIPGVERSRQIKIFVNIK